jgi:hypothetical protein
MRSIKTFILRLYTDPEIREKICGDLQALPGRSPFPFKSSAELLHLLHNLTNEEAKNLPMRNPPDENEPG